MRDNFRAQRCDCILNKLVTVVQVYWDRHGVNNFEGLVERNLETIRDC